MFSLNADQIGLLVFQEDCFGDFDYKHAYATSIKCFADDRDRLMQRALFYDCFKALLLF